MTKLKDVRVASGLTQAQLAEKAGINVRVLQHYEQMTKNFDHARVDTLLKVCVALNCKLEDVIENSEYLELLKKYSEQ